MEMYEGRKIHIPCAANMRVTAFLGLYLMVTQGQTESNAFESMRSIWEPNDITSRPWLISRRLLNSDVMWLIIIIQFWKQQIEN